MDDTIKPPTEPPNILLVDDEPSMLSALNRVLRSEGYCLHFARSAEEGLVILNETPIDLILTDMRMPQMDGVEFLSIAAQKWPDTTRILLSGFSDVSSLIDIVNKGKIYHFLTKPWEDVELKLALKHGLDRQRLLKEHMRLLEEVRRNNEELCREVELRKKAEDKVLLDKQVVQMENYGKTKIISTVAKEIMHYTNEIRQNLNKACEQIDDDAITSPIQEAIGFTGKLQNIFTQINDLMALDLGEIIEEQNEINIHDFMKSLYEEYEYAFNQAVDFKYTLDPKVPKTLILNHKCIYQILELYLENAFYYTQAGSVELTVSMEVNHHGEHLKFSVKDSNPAIEPKDQMFLFSNHFFLSLDERIQRHGMGLTICRKIATSMGGDVGVTSNDEGNEFWFKIPLQINQYEHRSSANNESA